MNQLWTYQNYVEHLSHASTFVRKWAFEAIEKQFPRKVTKEVSHLIGDPDEHLACMAPRYLASHGVTEFTPDIIESFKQGENNVPGNCAMALGDLLYEPALDDILERLSNAESLNTFLGILYYLGKIRQDDCRQILIKILNESADSHYVDMVAYHLLKHGNSEDIPVVLETYLAQLNPDHQNDMFLKHLMNSMGAEDLYEELTDYSPINILESPLKVLEEKLKDHPGIEFAQTPIDEIVRLIQKEDYQSVCTTLMFEAQNTVRKRFPDHKPNDSDYLDRIFELDSLNVSFLKEFSKQSAHWKSVRQNKKIGGNHIAAIISSYYSIIERESYFEMLASGDYSVESLINILKDASKEFPEILLNRLIDLSPIDELKSALSEELLTWGDIWIVRLMGKIGIEEFVPDLIRVVSESDGMDYIHTDAVSALNGIDESGHERIFFAIADGDIKDPFDVCSLLEHLPYAESFDHAVKIWVDDGKDSLDSYESYAVCLERIGDIRGIEALLGIIFEGNMIYIGDSLETLCALHKTEIPELEIIRKERKIKKERQRKRMMELDELAEKASKRGTSNTGTQASNVNTFKRNTPKVGRNEPCPCGSGKKYKKCCLDKK